MSAVFYCKENSELRIVSGKSEVNCELLSSLQSFEYAAIHSNEPIAVLLTNIGLLTVCGSELTITDQNYSVHLECENDLYETLKKEIKYK